ncbi:MAG TPA: MarR family transcriptional regulator [Candidatus Sulfotelmatobacter sp.]|jgi:predicted transcriptional regulator
MARKKSSPIPVRSAPSQDLMGRELSDAVVFFHEAVAAHLGMNAAEWKCLGLLERHGASTATRLAELSGFTTGAITGIVDRLERAGYVRRQAHPTDRRSVIVQPLPVKGLKERIVPVFHSLGQAMAEVTRRYSGPELVAIARFFTDTTAVLRNETAKLKHSKNRGGES